MTGLSTSTNQFLANDFLAQDLAARNKPAYRKFRNVKGNLSKAHSSIPSISVTKKTKTKGLYYEFRAINNLISKLQYFLSKRKSMNRTLTKIKALEFPPRSEPALNEKIISTQEELKILHMDLLKLNDATQIKVPPLIKFTSAEIEILNRINKNSIKFLTEIFFPKRKINSDSNSCLDFDTNYSRYVHDIQLQGAYASEVLAKRKSDFIKNIDITTKFINEDNELIEDTITRLQSASDNFTIEINSRNKSYKKTRNCFTAIKICGVAKALLVNKSKVSLLAHSKTLFNDGLVLLQ